MGMYPYDCVICGGAYDRCGTGQEEECECGGEGGQFCWENSVVCQVEKIVLTDLASYNEGIREDLQLNETHMEKLRALKVGDILEGEYDGGGRVIVEEYDPIEFVLEEETWAKMYVVVKVWCKSCYDDAERNGKL